MVAYSYAFRPMAAADLPTVRRWLTMPHVAEWWGDPDEQFGLVSEDLHHPAMHQFIVALEERPFGYLQCYEPRAWPQHGLGKLSAGTRGIDQFIGEAGMIGQGHGSAMIRVFVDNLLAAGAPRVITESEPGEPACDPRL